MDIESIMESARQELTETSSIQPKGLIEFTGKDGNLALAVVFLDFSSQEVKKHSRHILKKIVLTQNSEKYWVITEGWMSQFDSKNPDHLSVAPSRDADRKEVILVMEFTKQGNKKLIFQAFKRANDNSIVFEDKQDGGTDKHTSLFDVWADEKDVRYSIDKSMAEVDEVFLRNLSKKVADKYKDEFFKAETLEERKKVIQKIIAEGLKAKKEMNKKILEDVGVD